MRGACFDGSVRLVDGDTPLDGRVEVCIGGTWGTACQLGWGSEEAAVVCQQLEYPRSKLINFLYYFLVRQATQSFVVVFLAVGTAYSGGVYPAGTGGIYLMDTACQSNHDSLLECPFNVPFVLFCSHNQDSGVKCYEDSKLQCCLHKKCTICLMKFCQLISVIIT